MSLTATLLNNSPVKLPKGRVITHSMDNRSAAGEQQADPRNRADKKTSAANTELIFHAIAAGADSTKAIADATGLGKSTIQRALVALENWPTGARILRTKSYRANSFIAINA